MQIRVVPPVLSLLVLVAAAAAPPADKPFVVRTLVSGETIIEAARLAAARGGAKVKPIAETILADHEPFCAALLKLAEQRQIHPPQSKTQRHRRVIDRLSSLQGAPFDRAFADAMSEEHNDAIALFKRQVEYGKDEELKTLARERLPVLESHLTASRQLARQLAAAATTTSRPATPKK